MRRIAKLRFIKTIVVASAAPIPRGYNSNEISSSFDITFRRAFQYVRRREFLREFMRPGPFTYHEQRIRKRGALRLPIVHQSNPPSHPRCATALIELSGRSGYLLAVDLCVEQTPGTGNFLEFLIRLLSYTRVYKIPCHWNLFRPISFPRIMVPVLCFRHVAPYRTSLWCRLFTGFVRYFLNATRDTLRNLLCRY